MAEQTTSEHGDEQRPSPWGAYAADSNGPGTAGGTVPQAPGTVPQTGTAPQQPTTRLGAMDAGGNSPAPTSPLNQIPARPLAIGNGEDFWSFIRKLMGLQ